MKAYCMSTASFRKDKQTLLFVDYALPIYDRFAGSRTNFMYLALLVKMGLNVKFIPANFEHLEPYSSELKKLGIEVLAGSWFKKNCEAWFKEYGQEIDYVFLHKPDPAIIFLDIVKQYTHAAIIYQCHDLHYLRLQRKAELENNPAVFEEARIYQQRENYIFANSDVILTFSKVEEKILRKDFPQKQVFTVPLFFYEDVPEPRHDFNRRRDLLYVGGFDHAPNRDAVLWFCDEVFPRVLRLAPDIVFNVIGANPPKKIALLQSRNINILGSVSDVYLQKFYETARLSVVPLRFGAGVKGKTIEALYHGVPLVSTTIGLEGIAGIEQVATPKDDPEAFASEILFLYEDQNKWEERSMLGAKFVADHFTVEKTAALMGEIIASSMATARKRLSASSASLVEDPLRLIAFYLPQYHPIPENDEWWGKGFTEWRNVCKAEPLFPGHYQPHIPADLGFYDLRLEETRIAQAELASEYGISGFCYYHYWFNGKRLLERPAEEMLASGKPDFPFCLCWANENWTRRWDGEDQLVLMKQKYSEADDRAHIRDLFRFFRDKRYIRVDGKPVFLVYRTENMPDPTGTARVWREEARQADVGELYLIRVESIGRVDPHTIGFDAALEFAPDWSNRGEKLKSIAPLYPDLSENFDLPAELSDKNHIHYYDVLMERMLAKEHPAYQWFRCVTPSWDNSARRSEGRIIFLGSTPDKYRHWLQKLIHSARLRHSGEERLVFINAWNEWAEGNHLEPDQKHGCAYLEATRSAIDGEIYINQNKFYQDIADLRKKNEAGERLNLTRQPPTECELQTTDIRDQFRRCEENPAYYEQQITELRSVVKMQERLIEDLLNSKSWKVTAPLRWWRQKFFKKIS